MSKEVKQFVPKTAVENWEYNTKRAIPDNYELVFIDGNKENISFRNLKLVKRDKPVKEEPVKEEPVEEVKEVKKAVKKTSKK